MPVTLDWSPATGGVPQRLVLGALVFAISLDELDENVQGFISKFVDVTKTGGIADSEDG